MRTGVNQILRLELSLVKGLLSLVAFRLVELKMAALIMLLEEGVIFEVFETNCTFENLSLAEGLFKHLLVSVQGVPLHTDVCLQVQILLTKF